MVLAPMIKGSERISRRLLIMCCVAALILLILTKRFVYTYSFIVLPCLLLFANFFERKGRNRATITASFFGKISLESYLFNGAIQIYIIWIITLLAIPDYNNIIMYTLVVILGTLLSFITNRMCNPISKNILRKFVN